MRLRDEHIIVLQIIPLPKTPTEDIQHHQRSAMRLHIKYNLIPLATTPKKQAKQSRLKEDIIACVALVVVGIYYRHYIPI